MIQIYFLSIALNLLTGYILVFGNEDYNPEETVPGFSLRNEKFRLILGIATMAVGLLKILSVTDGDVRVVGDLLPAAAGLVSGFILLYEYFKNHTTIKWDNEGKTSVQLILMQNRKIIGIAAIVIAILHFLFPRVLFL
ncbi:MAG: hypothetical protein FWD78_04160 [Treponema sp.]|nr:hypothetical protein [Treponema sp.]